MHLIRLRSCLLASCLRACLWAFCYPSRQILQSLFPMNAFKRTRLYISCLQIPIQSLMIPFMPFGSWPPCKHLSIFSSNLRCLSYVLSEPLPSVVPEGWRPLHAPRPCGLGGFVSYSPYFCCCTIICYCVLLLRLCHCNVATASLLLQHCHYSIAIVGAASVVATATLRPWPDFFAHWRSKTSFLTVHAPMLHAVAVACDCSAL